MKEVIVFLDCTHGPWYTRVPIGTNRPHVSFGRGRSTVVTAEEERAACSLEGEGSAHTAETRLPQFASKQVYMGVSGFVSRALTGGASHLADNHSALDAPESRNVSLQVYHLAWSSRTDRSRWRFQVPRLI